MSSLTNLSAVRLLNISTDLPTGSVGDLFYNTAMGTVRICINSVGPVFDSLAMDSSVVHLAGNETITGAKTFSAILTVSNTTESTAIGTGALVTSGGLSVAKNLRVGGIIYGDGSGLTGTASGLTAGTVTTNANLSGDVSSVGNVTTIGANKVTLGMMQQQTAPVFLGRVTTGTGNIEALTPTQATSMLNTFGTLKGLVPGVTPSTTQFLRADGTFAVPPLVTTTTPGYVSAADYLAFQQDSYTRIDVADTNYNYTGAGNAFIAVTSLTADRFFTVPAASTRKGQRLWIVDESGSCNGSKRIIALLQPGDSLSGGVNAVLNYPYGAAQIESDGVNKWTIISTTSISLSAGISVEPTITDNNNGTVTVSNGVYSFYANADGSGRPKQFPISGGTLSLTNQVTNYVVADYNNGSPILYVTTNVSIINETTIIPVFTIFRQDNTAHILTWDTLGIALVNKLHQSVVKTQRVRVESGGFGLGETTGRVITIGAGTIWVGAVKHDLAAVNSSTTATQFWYHSGGSWTYSLVTTYNNTQYDNGTDLVSLNPNKYAVIFVYRSYGTGSDGEIFYTLGQGNYDLGAAQAAQPFSPPPIIASHAGLVGRIIIQNGAAVATQIDSAFNTLFTPAGVTDHNSLANLQGGAAGEFYHLTSAQLTNATSVATTGHPGLLPTLSGNVDQFLNGNGAYTSVPNTALANSSITIGTTNIALGATSTTLAGLTSVTSTTFVGALSGNADTATAATNIGITNDVATATPVYLTWVTANTGNLPAKVSSTKLSFVPSTGVLSATQFSGSGAGLTNIPNSALVNSSITIGTTTIALGASSTTLAGLTSVTSTTFIGALSGNATTATTATNIVGGAAGSIPYQTAAGTTTTLAAGTGVLVGGTIPSYTTTPTLTGTNFSGIPNGALLNSTITIGTTTISLGGTSATLSGVTSIDTTAAGTLTIGDTNASNLNLGTGSGTQTINIGTGTGATTINIGGSGDTVNIAGTLTYINTTDLTVTDKYITINKGGAAASANGAGIGVEEGGVITATIQIGNSRNSWTFATPAKGGSIWLTPSSGAFTAEIISTTTANRQYTLPDVTGTIALTSSSITGSAGSVANALTFNNSGTGATSGSTFNGSAAVTISYNSIGAQPQLNGTGLVRMSGTTVSYDNTTYATDSLVVHLAGTETVTGAKTFSAIVTISNATASTNTTTGALIVTGGIGSGGQITGTSFVKNGGTSSQFLKADGSVDATTYANDSLVVHLAGTETITGVKTFTSTVTIKKDDASAAQTIIQGNTNTNQQLLIGYNTTSDFGNIQAVLQGTGYKELKLNASGGLVSIGSGGLSVTGQIVAGTYIQSSNGTYVADAAAGSSKTMQGRTAGVNRWILYFGNATAEAGSDAGSDFQIAAYKDNGVLIDSPIFIGRVAGAAMQISRPVIGASSVTATSFVKSGGTSSQFLKADGSVDTTTYATDTAVVHIAGTETITGTKTFTPGSGSAILFNYPGAAVPITVNVTGPKNPAVQINGGDSNENQPASLQLVQPSLASVSARGPEISFVSTRATATQVNAGTFVAVQNTDMIGRIWFGGDTGATRRGIGAFIQATAIETWSATSNGSKLEFGTTPSGAASATTRLTIDQNGLASFANNISVSGTSTFASPLILTGSVGGQGAAVRYLGTGGSSTAWYFNAATGGNYTFAIGESYAASLSSSVFQVGANSTSGTNMVINGAAGSNRGLKLTTASVIRWFLFADSSTESGSNTGSNLEITAYDDAGTFVDTPVLINRAVGGSITMVRPVAMTNTTDASSTITGALVVSGGVGIAKKLYVGSTFTSTSALANPVYFNSTNASGFYTTYQSSGSDVGYIGVGSNAVPAAANTDLVIAAVSTLRLATGNTIRATISSTGLATFGFGVNSTFYSLENGLIDDVFFATSTTAANQVVDSNSATTYRAAVYQITIASGTTYQVTEIKVIHDGTNVWLTQYGTLSTGSSLATFTADISAGNLRLLTTPVNASTNYRVIKTLIIA